MFNSHSGVISTQKVYLFWFWGVYNYTPYTPVATPLVCIDVHDVGELKMYISVITAQSEEVRQIRLRSTNPNTS